MRPLLKDKLRLSFAEGGGGGTPQHQQSHQGMPPYHASVPQPTPSPAGDMSPGGGGGGGHAHMPSGSPPMTGGQGWPPPPVPPVHHGGYGGFPPHHPMAAHHHHHQHGVHPQDIKPLPMHGAGGAAGQQMPFQQYSWYQTQATAAASDGSMNAGLLT